MRKFYLIIACINMFGLLAWGQRSELNFDRDWRFARFGLQADGSRVEEPDSLQSYSYNDWDWRRLDVPHDWGSRDLSVLTWMDIPENCLGRGSVGIVNTLKYPRRIKRNGFIWISMVRWRMPKCGLMGIKWANGLSDTALFGSI